MKRSTLLLLLTSLLISGFLQAAVDFLPANQAFKASVALENQQLLAHWEIAEGYYLYQSRISFQAKNQSLPVVLDFYADWCASCKVMEKQVFN